jgi:hypothetical protein
MIKRLLLHVTRVISAGWCAECWLGGAGEPPEDDPRGLKHVGAKYKTKKYRL